ncbi:MAG: urease accessory UreF family protein [Pseudomonadota bacterium]
MHLLHLASPALPIGAYAYSQGLEQAIEEMGIRGSQLESWLNDGLQLGLAHLELPVIRRVFDAAACEDWQRLNEWNDTVLAFRETEELLLEDQQLGLALARLLRNATQFRQPELTQSPSYSVMFALAAYWWSISVESTCHAFCYSWLENQITAATKLVPLGQTEAQRMLLAMLNRIPEACEHAWRIDDEDLGLNLPGLALASARHEYQHTRLFRS